MFFLSTIKKHIVNQQVSDFHQQQHGVNRQIRDKDKCDESRVHMEDESSLTNEIREINQPRSAINKVFVQYIYNYIYSRGSSRKMCCSGSVYFGVPNMRNQKRTM